jgi:hypothetical protein
MQGMGRQFESLTFHCLKAKSIFIVSNVQQEFSKVCTRILHPIFPQKDTLKRTKNTSRQFCVFIVKNV